MKSRNAHHNICILHPSIADAKHEDVVVYACTWERGEKHIFFLESYVSEQKLTLMQLHFNYILLDSDDINYR